MNGNSFKRTFVALPLLAAIVGCGRTAPPAFVGHWRAGDQSLTLAADGVVIDRRQPPAPEVAALEVASRPTWSGTWTSQESTLRIATQDGMKVELDWEISNNGNTLTLHPKFGTQQLAQFQFQRDVLTRSNSAF